MSRSLALLLLLLAGVALALRWPQLGQRPMHNDEAVNGIKFGQLWTHGAYKYDPNEHHGPTLYYATLALSRLTAAPDIEQFTETRLRLVTVLFGAALVLLLALTADGLGRNGTLWAAVFTVLSPAMVFYSRDYIHETLLVSFTFLALGAGWRYWCTGKLVWAVLAGAGLGLMHATKETFVITLACAGLALILHCAWNRCLETGGASLRPRRPAAWHLAAAIAAWLVAAVLLFTSFFTNASGPLDSIRTYLPWLQRAGGDSPHIHPWTFYLQRVLFFHAAKGPVWTEAVIFALACVGAAAGFVRKNLGDAQAGFVRFLALYTFLLTAAYSVISYKTPWLLLNFWHGTILLAGVGAAVLLRAAQRRTASIVLGALLTAGCAHLGWQAWQASTTYAADRRCPYVYAQTSPDILDLVHKLEALAQTDPAGRQMLVKVTAPNSDYWPLPWYLRRFQKVGWWEALPPDTFAPVMIVSAQLHAGLDANKTHLMVGYVQLRPEVFFELYVELNLWRAYLAKFPPHPE